MRKLLDRVNCLLTAALIVSLLVLAARTIWRLL